MTVTVERELSSAAILDIAAAKLGLDRAELRRRNLLGPDDLPYDIGELVPGEAGAVYDKLFAEYVSLHDYFGRGANDVMKSLKELRRQRS